MNTDTSKGKGKHWIAIWIDIPRAEICYYDSLVSYPTKTTLRDIKLLIDKIDPEVYLKLKTNMIQDQSNLSENCGFFSSKFLIDMRFW